MQPIELRGRTIARNFWGRRWCEHLESFSEHAARLAHGRAYVRSGSICHLAVEPGGVDALVSGSALYRVTIRVRQLETRVWTAIRRACAGRMGSLADLHEGRLPEPVAAVLTSRVAGVFPQPGEIVPSCECKDRAAMCKHAAAVLSGVGSRLDDRPELLFRLRGVDETELLSGEPAPAEDGAAAGAAGFEVGNGRSPTAAVLTGSPAEGWPGPDASAAEPAGPAEAPPPRRVKKTLTYRPPTPAAGLPRAAPARALARAADDALVFEPTGELVADLRAQCGCSVAEFADLLQVTPTSVRRWESLSGSLNLHARPRDALLALFVEIEKHRGQESAP